MGLIRGLGLGLRARGEVLSMIAIKNLNKSVTDGDRQRDLLRALSLELDKRDFLALFGRSGSGKSVLLRCIAGLELPESGSVIIDGTDITKLAENERTCLRRDRIGVVFRSPRLLPTLSVRDNVALPALLRGQSRSQAHEKAELLLDTLKVAAHGAKRPDQLALADQQRVSIARALINNPMLLLADEPTGDLDANAAARLLEVFRRIHDQHETCVLMFTHSEDATTAAKRVATLRDGRIFLEAPTARKIATQAAARPRVATGTPAQPNLEPMEALEPLDTVAEPAGKPKPRPSSKGAELLAEMARKKKEREAEPELAEV